MNNNLFFKPTQLYKEFLILDLIEKAPKITQRMMSDFIGISVSMINAYLETYEKQGYIVRKYHSTKTVEYFVTKKGIERRKLLNIWYLQSSHGVYMSAKNNISIFLNQIIEKGFKNILLYGAGEVAEILLQTLIENTQINLRILAVIDDDINKQGKKIFSKPIITTKDINHLIHDGILISSYKHRYQIYNRILKENYPENKILNFFEV